MFFDIIDQPKKHIKIKKTTHWKSSFAFSCISVMEYVQFYVLWKGATVFSHLTATNKKKKNKRMHTV